LGDAFKAGKSLYVAYGKTANVLLPLSDWKPLPEGKMWDISSGQPKPVDIPAGFTVGATALDELRGQIENDPDNWQKYKQDFISRFGVEGQLNDFALQTLLDPLNVAPYTNAKLTEVVGKKTGNAALEYAGKMAQGNPVVDAIPFPFNGAVELISGGKLTGSKGFVGAMDAYKNFLQGNIPANLKGKIPYIAPKDYTRTQKMIAGLTDEGLPKNLVKQDAARNMEQVALPRRLFGKDLSKSAMLVAKEMTPESKALHFEYTLIDRLSFLHDLTGKDTSTFLKLIDASSKADPSLTAKQIGDIFEESGLARDYMDYREFNSPIGAAVATGLKKAVESGAMSEIIANFDKTAQNRAALSRYARFFGMDEGELLKKYKEGANFDSLIRNISDPARVEQAKALFPNGDTTDFKTNLALFTNKDHPVPYNDAMLGYAIVNSISNGLDGFLKERFGIKDNDPIGMRLSHTLKAAQSLAVLALNPRYAIYNDINNIVTRVATNNYGYTNWKEFVAKYEPQVARQDIEGGLSQDLINQTNSFLAEKNKTAPGHKILEGGVDKVLRKTSDIVGLATRFSRFIEKVESQQSFAVEYINAINKVRKVVLPPEITKVLPPDVAKSLQKILEGTTKTQDVDKILSHLSDPVVGKEIIDNSLSNFANGNEKLRASPEYYRELLTKTQIYDELVDGLNNAKSATDVATVFNSIDSHWQDYLNKLAENDIVSRVPDVANRIKVEGLPAALDLMSDMYIYREDLNAGKWVSWDYLYSLKKIADKDTWHAMFSNQVKVNAEEYARLSDWEQTTYDGFFEALGKQKTPESEAFLKSLKDSSDNNRKFFETKNGIWEEFGKKEFADDADFQKQYATTKAQIEQLHEQMVARDFEIQAEADRAIVALSGNDPKVITWRGELGKIKQEMNKSMTDFRKSLDEFVPPLTVEQKNAMYNKYITEEWLGYQAKLKDIETSGAHDLYAGKSPVVGEQALGTTPTVPNQSISATQGGYLFLSALMNDIKKGALDAVNNPKAKANIPQEAMPAIKKWLAQEKQNLASDKYFAQSWGESQRDFVMLNYTKKTNFDNALSFIFPYQFWYTNTMRNWALRMIDRPAIFNQYFRYRQAQENMERSGIPARLEGKMSAFAPWLPEWMGDTLWSDPMGQLYPFSQALQPFLKITGLQDEIITNAGYALKDMVKAGKISKAEEAQAKQTQSGAIWEEALAKATDESALSDPSSMVSLLMQPGMQWDILWKLIAGHPEKISPTPAMKTGQAIETMINQNPGADFHALTWLETNARKAMGMSPSVAKYGQFGDYYVERMLSNMAFEGTITSQQAKEAMITHQGTAWEQADQRVAEELSLKTPGVLPVVGALNGANFWQVTTATFQSMFPQGLLPQGELIYKGQQQEYNLAYDKYKAGDKNALRDFYNEHPEYETRSALYTKDPEARLKQYIIGSLWDTYMGSSGLNKGLISEALGDDFEKKFLSQSGDVQAMIPLETLMIWAKTMGNTVPQPEAMPDFSAPEEVQNLDLWSENVTKSYDQFIKEREALYPLYYGLQQEFYSLSDSEQKRFLKANPSLDQYWKWKAKYEEDHPELAPVFASQVPVNVSKNPDVELKDLDPTLVKQLNEYYTSGTQLTAGAWELLAYEWEQAGRPNGTLKKWMSNVIEPALTGKEVPQQYSSFWTDELSSLYGRYKAERDSRFPNYTALNEAYNSLSSSAQKRAFLDQNPQLKEAWAWKDEYVKQNPSIAQIFSYFSSMYGNEK